jgi:hypothetical protein
MRFLSINRTTATTSAVAAGVAQRAVSSSTTTMQSLPGTKKSSSSGGGAAVLERPPKLEFVPVAEKDDPKFCDKYKVCIHVLHQFQHVVYFHSVCAADAVQQSDHVTRLAKLLLNSECVPQQRDRSQYSMYALLTSVVLTVYAGSLMQVMLFNDSGNTRDYVARSLVQVYFIALDACFTALVHARSYESHPPWARGSNTAC